MLESLQSTLGDAGYTLILGRPYQHADRTVAQFQKMIQQGVECMILMGRTTPRRFSLGSMSAISYCYCLYLGKRDDGPTASGFDNFLEMSKLTQHCWT